MTTERIMEIQETTGYPNSVSVQQALLQVWNEVRQESVPAETLVMPKIAEEIDKLLLNRQEFLDKKIKDDFYNKGTGWTQEEERAYILGRKHEADNNRNLLAKFFNSNFSA